MNPIKRLFLSDKFILAAILINTACLYLGGYCRSSILALIDDAFTILFIVEILLKVNHYSWKKYWRSKWNRFDFIITMIALPSLCHLIFPEMENQMNFVLCIRLLRIFKMLRLLKFIPNVKYLVKGMTMALRSSVFVVFGFMLMMVMTSIVLYGFFGNVVPDYFGNPLKATYTTFRFFTTEGWYEIPDAIAKHSTEMAAGFTKVAFCVLLFVGGIIGMSLVNSIFVDAMANDNNEEVLKKLKEIQKQLNELKGKAKISGDEK